MAKHVTVNTTYSRNNIQGKYCDFTLTKEGWVG